MKKIVIGALLSGSVALAGLGLSMGTAQAWNPQPDPPGKVATSPITDPGVIRGFNPQPDPPGFPGLLNPGLIGGFTPLLKPPTAG
jgi:hypothetical protein